MFRYRLILLLLSIPAALTITWLGIRGTSLRFILQRLGLFYPTNTSADSNTSSNKKTIWIHAASVGEVNAVKPLIHKLRQALSHEANPALVGNNNDINIVLTTNTISSATQVEKTFAGLVRHYFCPLDWRWAVKHFINRVDPGYLWVVETELWPNLYSVCDRNNVPVVIINGRLSPRTLKAKPWLLTAYANCLGHVSHILARNSMDAENFIKLGANRDIVQVKGNLKFSSYSHKTIIPIEFDRHFVLAASTRDDEEILIVKAWQQALSDTPTIKELLLVIVPRHPQRTNTILQQLKPLNLDIAVRSKNASVNKQTDIYIADTFGELQGFILGSEYVIMGGSLIDKGGQNILEPAHLGKAVIFGPSMYHFIDEAEKFVTHQAGVQVENAEQLAATIREFNLYADYVSQLSHNASELMAKHQDTAQDYVQTLLQLFPELS